MSGTDGKIIIGTEIDTKSFDAQIDYIKGQMESIEEKLKQADMGFEVGDTQKLEAEYEKLGNKLNELIKKKEEFNKKDFSGIKTSIEGIGDGIEKATKKVARWALAIFGIRGAISFIKRSVSTLSQYDDQLAVNIEYIRYLLANTLKPIIETLVGLAYKLLAYINYIAQAWFGVNLFASASLKAFEKQQKSLKGTNKEAKELSKTLSGFDEMNIIQDKKKKDDTGIYTPSFPKMEDVKIPSWLQWIVDNRETVLNFLSGLIVTLAGIKLGLSGIQSLGIGIAVMGVAMTIEDILKFIDDPSWENFINVLGDIAIAIGGVMLATGNWWGALVVIIGMLVKLVINNWDSIKKILGKVGSWINDHIIKPVAKVFNGLWATIKGGVSKAWNFIRTIFSKGGKIFVGLVDGISNVFKSMVNAIIEGINTVIAVPFKVINGLLNTIRNAEIPVINVKRFKGLWSQDPLPIPEIPRLAKGGILNNPGRGVYTGSAIAGESGKELYMPLEDEQMLNLIGQAIGKYITINANITNTMNGRVISRELKRIQNESDFAFNR